VHEMDSPRVNAGSLVGLASYHLHVGCYKRHKPKRQRNQCCEGLLRIWEAESRDLSAKCKEVATCLALNQYLKIAVIETPLFSFSLPTCRSLSFYRSTYPYYYLLSTRWIFVAVVKLSSTHSECSAVSELSVDNAPAGLFENGINKQARQAGSYRSSVSPLGA
jgi:hypothetical protein